MNNLKITFVNLFIASLLLLSGYTATAQTVDIRFGNSAVDCTGAVPQFCTDIEIKANAGSLTVGNCNFFAQYNDAALEYSSYSELGFNTGDYQVDHNDFSGFGFGKSRLVTFTSNLLEMILVLGIGTPVLNNVISFRPCHPRLSLFKAIISISA